MAYEKLMVFTARAILFVVLVEVAYGKETLRLGALVSSRQAGTRFDHTGFLLPLELALETINNDSTLQYTFEVTISNSMYEATPTLRSFIDQILNQNLIMLIGADCSVATEPVAELAPNWNLVQISPGSTSPRLSNEKLFPLFLGTVSSDADIAVGITAAMKRFGWSRVALITQSENIFTFFSTEFKSHLNQANLQLIEELTFNTDEAENNVELLVNTLKNSPARIIFLNMYQENAIRLMCEALENNMVHPEYAWMFFNWYNDNWWAVSFCMSHCVILYSQSPSLVRRFDRPPPSEVTYTM
ncbi:gamma-aminobutyric acid type B receptor subunit 2-like isoform X2 [Dysidea avara]|uniref:gamma-aminobutyric acid type B receptor subunit 2-like isoform X2 n=1 Tax=Dysidea avara TaxID=196820 RepID=UPI00331B5090